MFLALAQSAQPRRAGLTRESAQLRIHIRFGPLARPSVATIHLLESFVSPLRRRSETMKVGNGQS
jgi:hypothetical protein